MTETTQLLRPRRKKNRSGVRRKKSLSRIPDIRKIYISPSTQQSLGCVIDDDVSIEKPWVSVKKDLFEYDIELHDVNSNFFKLKDDIMNFPTEFIFIGFAAKSDKENQFYICLSETAENHVRNMLKQIEDDNTAKLYKNIERSIGEWKSLGSEVDVDLEINRNNRPLFEVFIESKYPIMSETVKFKYRFAEDVVDGYMQLLYLPSFKIYNVQKRMLNAGVQVTATKEDATTQTVFHYKKNMQTQYEYLMDETVKITMEFKKNFTEFIKNDLDVNLDRLYFNSYINLYRNDYQLLIKYDQSTKAVTSHVLIQEDVALQEVDICLNKRISSVSWNYCLSGIVVIAYSNDSANINISENPVEDEVSLIVHHQKPVLLWSLCDTLNYKLHLDAPRIVTCVSCCPYNTNIIIGGMANGQVIMWDISNKLEGVETEEILNQNQLDYRKKLFEYMTWMKITKNLAFVQTTALSDLFTSHSDRITCIEWLPSHYRILPNGHIETSEEATTLQFVTGSLDGTLLFWDLKQKLRGAAVYKSHRKLRRLKERPSALTADVSPFRIYHRNLTPVYKINLIFNVNSPSIPIYCMCLTNLFLHYKYVGTKRADSIPRMQYDTTNHIEKTILDQDIAVGTITGDFATGIWEGFEYSSGASISEESLSLKNFARYHDGPIISINRWSADGNILLTVGGKIFAIWNKLFLGKPLMWRKAPYKYTHGTFGRTYCALIILTTNYGTVEYWELSNNTSKYFEQISLSGKFISGFSVTNTPSDKGLIGFHDSNNAFRIFRFPLRNFSDITIAINKVFKLFVKIEKVKKKYALWQEEWHLKNQASETPQVQEVVETDQAAQAELEEQPVVKSQSVVAAREKKTYIEMKQQEYIDRENQRMKSVLLALKHLNPDVLRKEQIPLKLLEKEQTDKKRKQRRRLARAEEIFVENIAINFPHVIKKAPPPPIDPYAGGDSLDSKVKCFDKYKKMIPTLQTFINNHPFYYDFNWFELVKDGYERRELFDQFYVVSTHRNRLKSAHEAPKSTVATRKSAESLEIEEMEEREEDF